MKYVDEYRDIAIVKSLAGRIAEITTREWTIMEICGGQTHSIMKYNLQEYLPGQVSLVHGPGCPVCVTPLEILDQAIHIARLPGVIFTTFGDMMRVPGSRQDLLAVKAGGADIRMVYSPSDAVRIAADNPSKKVVFFAVGFETTAPANAMGVFEAERKKLDNFYVLSSQVLVSPAIRAILSAPNNRIQAFLAAGHVCTIMGYGEYIPLAEEFSTPIVITGFEPVDILQGILETITLLEKGSHEVRNAYSRAVRKEGNPAARNLMNKIFRVCDRNWRGIGLIPGSGLAPRDEYARFDAALYFDVAGMTREEPDVCIAGLVLQGVKKPFECKAFGKECTPEHPLGAPMVSSEGACAAYYRFQPVKH